MDTRLSAYHPFCLHILCCYPYYTNTNTNTNTNINPDANTILHTLRLYSRAAVDMQHAQGLV